MKGKRRMMGNSHFLAGYELKDAKTVHIMFIDGDCMMFTEDDNVMFGFYSDGLTIEQGDTFIWINLRHVKSIWVRRSVRPMGGDS